MPTKKSSKSSERAASAKGGAARSRKGASKSAARPASKSAARPASKSAARGATWSGARAASAAPLSLAGLLDAPPEDGYSVVFLVNPQESTEETLRVAWPETSMAGGSWFDFPGAVVESAVPLGVEEAGPARLPKAALRIKPGHDDLVRMLRSHLAGRLGPELDAQAQTRGAALDVVTFDEEACGSDGEPEVALAATRGADEAAPAALAALELSGPQWVQRFPGSRSIFDTKPPFLDKLSKFHQALSDSGAQVSISATFRPPERAYLMHFAFKIANRKIDARQVPPMAGVNIQWFHGDDASSRAAAAQMVAAYRIAFAPVLVSRHTQGLAIDMTITWAGTLRIKDASGVVHGIGAPRNGNTNKALHNVGATYGVIKLASDPPHWSNDGH